MTSSGYPRQGDVYWTELEPTVGSEITKKRPCLVISSNQANRVRRTLIIVPLSTTVHSRLPFYVPIPSVGENSKAVVDQVRAADPQRFKGWITTATRSEVREVLSAIQLILGID